MGGSILASQLSIVTICGLVKNNAAIEHGGGIASIDKALLVLGHGSVFYGNSAGGSGGCVYAAGTSVTFREPPKNLSFPCLTVLISQRFTPGHECHCMLLMLKKCR
jgi:hypothetical protein